MIFFSKRAPGSMHLAIIRVMRHAENNIGVRHIGAEMACPDAGKFGVIELGACWLPGFMRQLDAAFEAFARHEERLQTLSLKPSEYIVRQVRVTPYPTEPTDWIISQTSPAICMFSTDYPHVEGGRNPLGRFDKATTELSASDRDRFFRANFEDLMGSVFEGVPT